MMTMNVALWTVQIVLGLMFAMAGVMKSTQPKDKLEARMPWVKAVSLPTLRFIGVSELLGGIGLIAPWASHIAPVLTPLAAAGLALIMVLAVGLHAKRGEYGAIVANVALGGLAAFVAWGRYH
jgi:uncharacterized membrane protein YphA (DoxX/SURF4 family)